MKWYLENQTVLTERALDDFSADVFSMPCKALYATYWCIHDVPLMCTTPYAAECTYTFKNLFFKIFCIILIDVQRRQNTTRVTFNKKVDKWRHALTRCSSTAPSSCLRCGMSSAVSGRAPLSLQTLLRSVCVVFKNALLYCCNKSNKAYNGAENDKDVKFFEVWNFFAAPHGIGMVTWEFTR